MTLAQFALAVNADTKWVQNASAGLGVYLAYSEGDARRLGLAKVIHETAGTPLRAAWEMAGPALAADPSAPIVSAESGDGSVRVAVDVDRYLCTFTAWLSRAYLHEPRRRGRPAVRERAPALSAESFGLDVSLIAANMRRPLAERLREADDAAELMNRFRLRRSG
ncbi:hypothetical protein [Longimicrobium sp.]|uniref:hypothetical protein n=1 Tax=Longimicrobium sp. TaxID=2029185 RepID=UPI002D7E8DF4|nr:hypothetical protein [Longimicrobium sp.]